jgi:hypothetical protein
MADVSFAHVPAEGFTAFGMQLEKDAWGSIDVSTYLGSDGRPAKPMGDAPTFVSFKIALQIVVSELVLAVQSTVGARGFDAVWDQTEKHFSALVVAARKSSNAPVKAAADRVFAAMLLGRGDGQTQLGYQQEVDFGRKQVHLSGQPQVSADIALLGLGPMIQAIAEATEDLAGAVSHGRADLSPSKQRKALVAKCNQVFGTIHRALDWYAEYGATGQDREKALALQTTLTELATKYPLRTGKTKTTSTVNAPNP